MLCWQPFGCAVVPLVYIRNNGASAGIDTGSTTLVAVVARAPRRRRRPGRSTIGLCEAYWPGCRRHTSTLSTSAAPTRAARRHRLVGLDLVVDQLAVAVSSRPSSPARGCRSRRSGRRTAPPLNPPNTSRMDRHPAGRRPTSTPADSGTIGRWNVTRSPVLQPAEVAQQRGELVHPPVQLLVGDRLRARRSPARAPRSAPPCSGPAPGAGPHSCSWRSADPRRTTSRTAGYWCPAWCASRCPSVSRSAYSLKHSGNFSSTNRSRIAGSAAFACATNFAGG